MPDVSLPAIEEVTPSPVYKGIYEHEHFQHFVQYHSRLKRGPLCEADGSVVVRTDKNIKDLPGNIVWVVLGSPGYSYQYHLGAVINVEKIGCDHKAADLKNWGRGSQIVFDKFGAVFDKRAWFRRLQKKLANFSLGLTRITDPDFIAGFVNAATWSLDFERRVSAHKSTDLPSDEQQKA